MPTSPGTADPAVGEMLARANTHRSTVLYSLEHPEGVARPSTAPRRGFPVAELFPAGEVGLYRRWHDEARRQLPYVRHAGSWSASDLQLTSASSVIQPTGARTWLFEMPSGSKVAGLTIDYRFADDSPALRPCPELFRDIDAGRYELLLGGVPLLEVCLADLDEDEPRPTWGADIHHLISAAPGSVAPAIQLDRDFAQRLVSRRADASRAEFLTVRLPSEANRFPDLLCAVTPGASAVAGHAPEVDLAFMTSAICLLAAISSMRVSQRRAFAALAEIQTPRQAEAPAPTVERRRLLKKRLGDLANLRLDLSFGVEAYLDTRLLVPSMPVVEFHHALVEALGLPPSAEVTGKMLTRLSQAMAAEAEEIAAEERTADERRWRTWSAVGGSIAGVAVPLSLILAFLGVSASDVNRHDSIGNLHRYGLYYLAIVAVVVVAVLVGRAYVALHYRRQRSASEVPAAEA
ncbi:MAG: hypothetical protein QOE56_1455 [Solirubrobacterales bacterium]|nr:hypothetical protein [Solirubrobacterales bacterium]